MFPSPAQITERKECGDGKTLELGYVVCSVKRTYVEREPANSMQPARFHFCMASWTSLIHSVPASAFVCLNPALNDPVCVKQLTNFRRQVGRRWESNHSRLIERGVKRVSVVTSVELLENTFGWRLERNQLL